MKRMSYLIKRIIVCALALAMLLMTAACGGTARDGDASGGETAGAADGAGASGDGENADDSEYGGQIRIIADNAATWLVGDDTELYNYAVTDLDQNGRLEIIASSCQGTGLYTFTSIWEINGEFDGLTPVEDTVGEGDSQADIIVSSAPVYTDGTSGVYNYVFVDALRNGAAEYYESMRAVSLNDGTLTDTVIAHRSEISDDAGNTASEYTDAEGSAISAGEYALVADTVFGEGNRKTATFGWVQGNELKEMDDSAVFDALKQSFDGFSIG